MSGLAEAYLKQGYSVSGSDRDRSEITDHLSSLGAVIYKGHDASHVNADVVVYTAAVDDTNPELVAAKKQGAICIKRAELLGEWMRGKRGIAVAGTHGKTTTSAMIGMMLLEAGFDPTMFIGGIVNQLNTNSRLGQSDWLVAEADEYDRSFWTLFPVIAVINNIESDHLDIYSDTEDIKSAFLRFANQTSVFGTVFINADDSGSSSLQNHIKRKTKTFGLSNANVNGKIVKQEFCNTHIEVSVGNKTIGAIQLTLNGKHNVSNALATVSVGLELNIPFETIAESLKKFRGTGRRFELLGEYRGAMIIDDYAHHPTEIRSTLQGVRDSVGSSRRIVAVFQPHLYSRTRDYLQDFANAFREADEVILTDIYAAREKPIEGISGERLFEETKKKHAHVSFEKDKNNLTRRLAEMAKPGDLMITMGAGDITRVGRELVKS